MIKILTVILLMVFTINPNLYGQKKWDMGFAVSGEKVIVQNRVAAPYETYTLKYGSSLNFIVQYEFNKFLFLRSGIGYYSFSHQYKANYPSSSYSTTIQEMTDGFIDLPLALGINSPDISKNLNFYATIGLSLSENFYTKRIETISGSYNYYSGYSYERLFQYYGRESFLMTSNVSLGLTIKTENNFKFFGGLLYRQQMINPYNLFGNVGIQLGFLCQISK